MRPPDHFLVILNLVILVVLLLLSRSVTSQTTQQKQSCSFYSEQAAYDVEFSTGYNDELFCKSVSRLNSKFKDNTPHNWDPNPDQISTLQTELQKVKDENEELKTKLSSLQLDLQYTKQAIKTNSAASIECPAGYHVRSDEYKSCYMFVGRPKDWYNAELFCMSTRGHLVAIETQAEQRYLARYIKASKVLPGNHMWTAGNDIAHEGKWMWAGINTVMNYTRWLNYPHPDKGRVQQPDNHRDNEHCVHLFHLHNYDWNDIYCGFKYFFICEYKLL